MTQHIVLLNHQDKTLKVIKTFDSISNACLFCEELIEDYIRDKQGDRPFEYTQETNISYGFYVKPSNSITLKWTIMEVKREVGILYNSYENKKHLTISISENPIDENVEHTDYEMSIQHMEYYNMLVDELYNKFAGALSSDESSEEETLNDKSYDINESTNQP